MKRQICRATTLALAFVAAISLTTAYGRAADKNLPAIEGKTYADARAVAMGSGWTPRENPAAHGDSPDVQSGNGPLFWSKGYHELQSCSGSGSAACRFEFTGAGKAVLVVITEGEEDEGGAYRATVSRAYIDKPGK